MAPVIVLSSRLYSRDALYFVPIPHRQSTANVAEADTATEEDARNPGAYSDALNTDQAIVSSMVI